MLKIDRESYERLIPPHARIHKDVAHSLCQALGCRFVPINRDKSGYREKLIKLCLEMSPDDPPTDDIFRQNGGVILPGRDSRKNPVVWMFLEGDCYMPVGVFFHELGHVWDPFSEDHYGTRKFCLDHGEEAFWQYREAMATGIGLVLAHCCERAKLCPGGAYAGTLEQLVSEGIENRFSEALVIFVARNAGLLSRHAPPFDKDMADTVVAFGISLQSHLLQQASRAT